MRFNEIVIDRNADANAKFLKQFKMSNNAKFSINNDGYVSASGTIALNVICSKLPIKFKHMMGNFVCRGSQLETLEGCPELVVGNFRCDNNLLTTLVGGPKFVKGDYTCIDNSLQSLDGLPEEIDGQIILDYEENLPLIGLLLIKGVKDIAFYIGSGGGFQGPNHRKIVKQINGVNEIMRKYLGKGKGAALACAAELIKAGFKGNARL